MLAGVSSLVWARAQMAVSLGFHIVFASLAIGLPVLMLIAEYRGLRHRDEVWIRLARRWGRSLGILVAVGAVSGTVLSFALGLFWPGLMGRWGAVIGLPFALEAFAFFVEAIFVGIYLYGWDRMSPWAHWWSGWPVVIGGAASAWFVVTANAWMQTPVGFSLNGSGDIADVQPIKAMLNPSTPVMTTHMLLAAYVASGLTVASVYAVGMLRGRRDDYHRRGLALALILGLAAAPAQILVGDRAAKLVAERQPIKLAAIEGLWKTTARAPLTIGGIPLEDGRRMVLGIQIPGALSWLAFGDADAVVTGLSSVPPRNRPKTAVVHVAFQLMVGIGFALAGLALWAAVAAIRRRRVPDGRWFLRAVMVAGPAAFVALESGWIVTELGRQPWIVQGYLRTADAATSRGGIEWWFLATVAVYLLLGSACAWLLLGLGRRARAEKGSAT